MNNIFRGRTVLVTGHTGFKGSWLSIWLRELGANVVGYALSPRTEHDNFVMSGLSAKVNSWIGDVRDYESLMAIFNDRQPEIVFHLAAQPIVRESYQNPKDTYDTNVGGTVNLLECCRLTDSVRVVVNVTTDKCYENQEWVWGYRETDKLGGYDPYSSSKACSELATSAYRNLLTGKHVATARAGNVIGGGDWQVDRLVPDCFRALKSGKPIVLRNPMAVRPWQFVLEPLRGYLVLASRLWEKGEEYAGAWNFAPSPQSAVTTLDLVCLILQSWGKGEYNIARPNGSGHEAAMLALDSTKANRLLGWETMLSTDEMVERTVDWYHRSNPDYDFCVKQIRDYEEVVHYAKRPVPEPLQAVQTPADSSSGRDGAHDGLEANRVSAVPLHGQGDLLPHGDNQQ